MKIQNRLLMMAAAASTVFFSSRAFAQIADAADARIANIPVNYTEAKVGILNLPDVLKTFDGQPVTDAKTWFEKRRPELLKYFETEYYGRVPATAPKVTWEVVSADRNALEGRAIMKVLAGHMGSADGPAIAVTLYTPADAKGPVPILTNISFGAAGGGGRGAATRRGPATATGPAGSGPASATATASAPASAPASGRAPAAPRGPGRGPGGPVRGGAAELISRGYGYAVINYTSIETDTSGRGDVANVNIARKLGLAPGQTAPAADEWGTIAAWAWGISRFVDYLETDPAVDAKRVAITGTSRLGKTVTWAGANDQRIALVIACCGGEGGAALARRNYGETIAHLVEATRFPYQFAGNYAKYGPDPNTSKVDSHCLVALMAPRPILLSTGYTDGWSDPYGEFQAAVAATPVFKLVGKQGLDNDKWPGTGETLGKGPIVGHELSFVNVNGGHGAADWDTWLKFMDTYLKPEK
jgi:hypothetical protein